MDEEIIHLFVLIGFIYIFPMLLQKYAPEYQLVSPAQYVLGVIPFLMYFEARYERERSGIRQDRHLSMKNRFYLKMENMKPDDR
ncbi:hypothetical protein FHP05_06425 [Cerasibacillus terrae]|uniref:Uncharacterized protein n=1 Tax=Cerasibacillus terrae TaxID=2498845 RepID=A0A5C8NXR0_9BACI|nr:hypothetical protein [Cerasibacillus terrae]TXL65753.1 hypothetical protein FHP05_06425 [Cerasibacillus terrae]